MKGLIILPILLLTACGTPIKPVEYREVLVQPIPDQPVTPSKIVQRITCLEKPPADVTCTRVNCY